MMGVYLVINCQWDTDTMNTLLNFKCLEGVRGEPQGQ